MEDAFTVTFACGNCGDEWEESYEPGVRVLWDSSREAMAHRDRACTELGYTCECCGTLRCPTCDLKQDVEDTNREPIVETEAAADAD